MNKRILKALEKEKAAREQRKLTVLAVQLACAHADWVEADYMSMNFGSTYPPVRMCDNCGLTEDGWGCGFIVLRDRKDERKTMVDRDYIRKHRQGLKVVDGHKGPLLRREVTLTQLIQKDAAE